MRIEEPPDK